MNETPPNGFQTSNREVKTALSSDVEMSIRKTDWKRVYRKVRTVPRNASVYEATMNLAWGISAAAFLALIPLYQATAVVEPWVKPVFWAVALAAAVVAVLAKVFCTERSGIVHSSCEEVLADMREVYETFFPNDPLDQVK